MNPLAKQAADTFKAIQALGFKPHQSTASGDGMILQKPGKPPVFLSHEDARRWAELNEEAQHG
jgi:hypothetical protein